MNCKHCGAKIAVFSRYCGSCGQEAHSLLEWMKIIGASTWSFLKKRLWLTASVGGALILSIVLLIILCRPNYINPMDYVITTTRGFDGNGQISVSIDYDALCEDILGEMPDASTKKGYEQNAKYQEAAERISETLNITTDRNSNLKNSEFYIVTVDVLDADIYKEFGCAFKKEVYKKTLQIGVDSQQFDEYVTVNLFDYIELSFNGDDSKGKLSVSNEAKETTVSFSSSNKTPIKIESYEYWGDYMIKISFPETNVAEFIELYIDKTNNLNNGDTVKLKIDIGDADNLREYGIIVDVFEKLVTVSGLNTK